MKPSNAWERAQEAIDRAAERSDQVITPDTAISPFDASRTTVIPYADVVRRGPPDPDTTQRLPHGRPPAPRRPGDTKGQQNGHQNGHHAPHTGGAHARQEPPPRPPELSDPAMPRVAPGSPGTAPFPAADPVDSFGPDAGTPPQGFPTVGTHEPRRPWWKRLFGR